MSEFEEWFLEVIGIADEKMSIIINVTDSRRWMDRWRLGLTPMQAVQDNYGFI